MATYKTTTEQLTSIANAIRAKTGSSESLVYPTGFVSAIGNISGSVWDGLGTNPQFLNTLVNESILLKDTDYENITISSSSQKIKEYENLGTITVDATNYEYVIINNTYINFIWNSQNQQNTYYPDESYRCEILILYPFIGSIEALINDTRESSSYSSASVSLTTLKRNNASNGCTTSNIGWSISNASLFSNGQVLSRIPRISINSGTYFASEIKNELNVNNTTIEHISYLYRYDKNSSYRNKLTQIFRDFYLSHHPTT